MGAFNSESLLFLSVVLFNFGFYSYYGVVSNNVNSVFRFSPSIRLCFRD